jgi:hypothetical protein
MKFLDWLLGRDLKPAEAPVEPVEPILPDDEPERIRSTAERRARGLRARIQREEIEGALDRMARRAAKAWAESGPEEETKREEAYRLVNVIRALRTELQTVVTDGEMAAHEERTKRPADNR